MIKSFQIPGINHRRQSSSNPALVVSMLISHSRKFQHILNNQYNEQELEPPYPTHMHST